MAFFIGLSELIPSIHFSKDSGFIRTLPETLIAGNPFFIHLSIVFLVTLND